MPIAPILLFTFALAGFVLVWLCLFWFVSHLCAWTGGWSRLARYYADEAAAANRRRPSRSAAGRACRSITMCRWRLLPVSYDGTVMAQSGGSDLLLSSRWMAGHRPLRIPLSGLALQARRGWVGGVRTVAHVPLAGVWIEFDDTSGLFWPCGDRALRVPIGTPVTSVPGSPRANHPGASA
ncbi:MAG: hypothetical protein AB7K09_19640 [Planctomycetota bacterium]